MQYYITLILILKPIPILIPYVFNECMYYMICTQDFFNAHPLQAAERARSRPPNSSPSSLSSSSSSRVLGGKGAVWTEHIDAHNLECRTWPRAGIIATKLWGGAVTENRIRVTTQDTFADPDDNADPDADAGGIKSSIEIIPVTPIAWSQSLHMSYIRFRYHLHQKGLAVSTISLHLADSNLNTAKLTPMFHLSETELLRHYLQDSSTFISNKTGQLMHSTHKMVSQCPDIPEAIQRPVWYHSGSGSRSHSDGDSDDGSDSGSSVTRKVLKSVFLNVAEGAHDSSRRQQLQQWFSDQADIGVSFIGLCELNGWQQLESVYELKYNFPRIRRIASKSGFAYSHVMASSSQPYNIGIISAIAFEVVAEYFPPLFQRGLLHVFFPSLRLHAFITHLHAHNSHLRELEATFLASLVSPIIQQNEMKVLVMGDLNTLSYADKHLHTDWSTLWRHDSVARHVSLSPIHVIERLKKKFCFDNSAEINYKPFHILANIGLKDSCSDFCRAFSDSSTDAEGNYTDNIDNTEYQKCYQTHCSYSEPTNFNPEVCNL